MSIDDVVGPPPIVLTPQHRKALALWLRHTSYNQIAATLGCTNSEAYRLVAEALDEQPRTRKEDHLARALNLVGTMTKGLWESAAKGDPESVRAMILVMNREAKYLGLDAPTRSEHTGKDGAPLQFLGVDIASLSDAQLEALRSTNDVRSIGHEAVPVDPDAGSTSGGGDGAPSTPETEDPSDG